MNERRGDVRTVENVKVDEREERTRERGRGRGRCSKCVAAVLLGQK